MSRLALGVLMFGLGAVTVQGGVIALDYYFRRHPPGIKERRS